MTEKIRVGVVSCTDPRAVDLRTDVHTLIKEVGSNHYSVLPGHYAREIEYACWGAKIEVERLNQTKQVTHHEPEEA